MRQFSLPKCHLIRKSSEYKDVFRRGTRFNYPFFLIYKLAKEDGPTRLGLVVSRKIGGAFLRNNYKRLIREFFRIYYTSISPHTDIVICLKKSVRDIDSASFRFELNKLLDGK